MAKSIVLRYRIPPLVVTCCKCCGTNLKGSWFFYNLVLPAQQLKDGGLIISILKLSTYKKNISHSIPLISL